MMETPRGEFTCRACGHNFNRLIASQNDAPRCPRCGSQELERSPYLLGTPSTEGLTFEDYCDVALAPCCTTDWKGWRQVFYSTAFPGLSPDPQAASPSEKEPEQK